MAAMSSTIVKDAGLPTNVTRFTMSASDTIPYIQGAGMVLVLYNTTASIVNVTFTGSAAPATISVPGIGGGFSLAGGKAVAVPATGATIIDLDDIYQYLQGTVTVTNGTGLVAMLYQ